MTGTTPYKKISLEHEIAAAQEKHDLASLDQPWQPQKMARMRLQMAAWLAVGLLVLFALAVMCNGIVIAAIIFNSMTTNNNNFSAAELGAVIEQIINFVSTLLPYIATPLGVALGYFFKESSSAPG